VLNALTFFDTHDELYWNVTGNGWEPPIERVTAEIDLPVCWFSLKWREGAFR
jgi:Predicted membrane protein (DUF2207)